MNGELIALAVRGDVLTQSCRCCAAAAVVVLVEGCSTPPLRQHAAGCPVPEFYAAVSARDRGRARRLGAEAYALASARPC